MRKVRWGKPGSGKSGGVRVIYFNRLANGEIWLVLIYSKIKQDSIDAKNLREIFQTTLDTTFRSVLGMRQRNWVFQI